MLGSCVGAALFIWLFYQAMATPAFTQYIDTMINTILALYQSSGSDVVQNALLQSITAEMVLETIKSILLRGGSLISCVILLFAGRQISMALVRIVYRNSFRDTEGNPVKAGTFSSFHVHPNMIWVLSVSLPMIILVNIFKLEIPEIILWNLLILCGILYLAQGFGIMRFFLAKPAVSPFLRFFLPLLFIVFLFSPVINAVLLGGVVLLGIAENWVPFRAPKQNGPPSTPEASDVSDDTSED